MNKGLHNLHALRALWKLLSSQHLRSLRPLRCGGEPKRRLNCAMLHQLSTSSKRQAGGKHLDFPLIASWEDHAEFAEVDVLLHCASSLKADAGGDLLQRLCPPLESSHRCSLTSKSSCRRLSIADRKTRSFSLNSDCIFGATQYSETAAWASLRAQ